MGLIDVNIPEFITMPTSRPSTADEPSHNSWKSEYGTSDHPLPSSNSVEYASQTTDLARKEGEKLAAYLWENYIEPYDFPLGILLIGAGHAFHAAAKLVSENDSVYPNLLGVVCFISTQPIRPVSNPSSHNLANWYKENSLVFVSEKHSLWKKEKEGARVSKRYGTLKRSTGEVLNGMMISHRDEVFGWMGRRMEERREKIGDGEQREDNVGVVKREGNGDGDGDGGKERESDQDRVDDPAAGAESGNDAGNGALGDPLAAQTGLAASAQVSGGDVLMTTEQ